MDMDDPIYRTCFLTFANSGVIYGYSNNNVNKALTRLTCARDPHIEGYDHKLRRNQSRWLRKFHNCDIHKFYTRIFSSVEPLDDFIVRLVDWVNYPHQKRRLRLSAASEVLHSGKVFSNSWHTKITGKLKRDEIAKTGGIPRNICDLTTPASLRSVDYVDRLKDILFSHPYDTGKIYAKFVKTSSPLILEEEFNHFLDDKYDFAFLYSSDDSILRIGSDMYNMDIKKCDASHTFGMFALLRSLCVGECRQVIGFLIDQLSDPLYVFSPSGHRCVLTPREPFLYSGSVLTTLINSLANLTIFASILDKHKTHNIIDSALLAGYQVSLDRCNVIQDLQFLKHSPMYDEHLILRPVINLGVILRLSGRCRGDPLGPRTLSVQERCFKFQQSLLRCFYNTPRNDVLNALITRFNVTDAIGKCIPESFFLTDYPDYHKCLIPAEQFMLRYRITLSEWQELQEYCCSVSFGDVVYCAATEHIFDKDYEMSLHPVS